MVQTQLYNPGFWFHQILEQHIPNISHKSAKRLRSLYKKYANNDVRRVMYAKFCIIFCCFL
jgi:hypothetical protein